MPKTRSEINRQNYLRNRSQRQQKARERKRQVVQSWRAAIAQWDDMHAWTEPPADWEATGLSQHAIESALRNPADMNLDAA